MKNLRLTKHLKELKSFPPIFTGGTIFIMKDELHGLAINDNKISLFNLRTAQVVG
jgi:hypothetical protein